MPHDRRVCLRRWAPCATAALSLLLLISAAPAAGAAPVPPPLPTTASTHIDAVVNGDVISNQDVDDRVRLFALSAGLPMTPDILDRLKPQILRQLIDEKLRMQEIQRRKIVVPDTDIAAAIRNIEQRNNLPPGSMRAKLEADGISLRTLIDQIRTQIGWTQVLREQLGDRVHVSDATVAAQQRLESQLNGKEQYRVGEIFIPVDDPADRADAERFTETVISELRKGAPFPVVAAEFSQNQTALQGGEVGWVEPNELDPSVAQLVEQMPVGAISNPVPVPGGFTIVTLQAKRIAGQEMGTVLAMRQVFLPFTTPLNPQAPTAQQQEVLQKARTISASVHSCQQMEQVAQNNKSARPVDPGPVQLEGVTPPAFRQLLATLPYDHASQPLVAIDGIAVVIVCSREQKNLAALTDQQMRELILQQRVELASRQLQRDLQRKASIQVFNKNGT